MIRLKGMVAVGGAEVEGVGEGEEGVVEGGRRVWVVVMEIEMRVEGGERREVWSCREEREWRGLKMQQQEDEAFC